MRVSKLFRIILSLAVIFSVGGLIISCSVLPDEGELQSNETVIPKLPQAKTLTDPKEVELYSTIQKAAAGREDVMAFIVFRVVIDHVEYSKDGTLALVWISMVDKQTGEIQNSEPGLVIAHATGDLSAPWRITFQADASFAEELMAVPDTMMSLENKAHYMPDIQQESKDGKVYTGYRLPWTKGQSVRLTGSIGHVLTYKSCPSTCLYAFDFANGTMFDIKAAKHGFVKYVQWTYANGNTTDANYIVLEDRSTTPTTYQVYYHLAQNSIPLGLRAVGTEVMQGQFLGKADDTGYSTGNHLHFHVHTTPGSVWGNSVDIVFDEVSINGGRPRTCDEASAFPAYGKACISGNTYISQNGDTEPPTGTITNPVAYSTITSPTVNVSGTMHDDTSVTSGQLLYNTGGNWIPIGEPVTESPFTREINLCDSRIPDGTFFLSIAVTDQAGKVSTGIQGLTQLTKSYTCEPLPPVCTPTETQVALFTDIDYQGSCQVLEIGDYKNLGELSPSYLDNVKSILIGSATTVLAYPDVDFGGMFELFQDGDANLADNTVGASNAASLKVVNRINPPEAPSLNIPEKITTALDLVLEWTVKSGEQTRCTLTGPDGYSQILEWQEGGTWPVGPLAKGDYTWTVETRNLVGTASISQEFTVSTPPTIPLSHLNDLPDITTSSAVLITWEVDQGEDSIDHFELQYRQPDMEWTDKSEKPEKDQRQMIFWGRPGHTYEFRLRAVGTGGNAEEYLSVAETSTLIVDNCVVDEFEGGDPGDDSISSPSLMELGKTVSHNWCAPATRSNSNGNYDLVDWVSFVATAGDQLRFTTEPKNPASAALLTLFEPDGTTYIGEARPDNADGSASLDWTAPVDGTYYFSLTPMDEQIVGTDTSYTVAIEVKSKVKPTTLICGSLAIPALLAGGYTVSKEIKKQKKRMERKAMGR